MKRSKLATLSSGLDRQAVALSAEIVKKISNGDTSFETSMSPKGVSAIRVSVSSHRKQKGVAIIGHFDHERRVVTLRVQLKPDYDFKGVGKTDLRAELINKVRHELEHSVQKGIKDAPAAAQSGDIDSMKSYYLDGFESKAHRAGLRAKAAFLGLKRGEVVDQEIEKVRHYAGKAGTDSRELDKLLGVVRKRWRS